MATINKIAIMQEDGSWIERDISVERAPLADRASRAECDESGANIKSNYVTGIEKNAHNLKVTKGNNSSSATLIDMRMTGATASSAGIAGFVPAPSSNDRSKVLSGAGTWINTVKSVSVNSTQLVVDGQGLTIPYASKAANANYATSAGSASNGISSFSSAAAPQGTKYTITRADNTQYIFYDTNTTYGAGSGISIDINGHINNTGVVDASANSAGDTLTVKTGGNTPRIVSYPLCQHLVHWGDGGPWEYAGYSDDNVVLAAGMASGSYLTQLRVQHDHNMVLYYNGGAIWSTGTSSQRFKHHIKSMVEERARKILDIRAVTFDWNDDQVITTQKNDNAGVIAEEVSKVIPDVVVFEETDEGRIERRVEYERFTPYLIKLAQMQQEQIEVLTKRVEELEANK